MSLSTATSPGSPMRANEDFVGSVPGAVVLLDAAGVPGMDEVCAHGARWYAQTLGGTILRHLTLDPVVRLVEALARALADVADQHRATCDLKDPRSPQASVAMARVEDDDVDVLVLADVFVLLELSSGATEVLTDAREVDVRRECLSVLAAVPVGTPAYAETLAQVVQDFRARRNAPGGYWVAKDDPAAAAHAVTARRTLHDVQRVSLMSNGVSRLVTTYRATTWPALVQDLHEVGPEGLLQRLRDVERELPRNPAHPGVPAPDDATIASWRLT